MTQGYALTMRKANLGAESACRGSGKTLPLLVTVMRRARALWPQKTDLHLQTRTGASERMCRYWLQEKYQISGDALAGLLRSEEGLVFLEEIMGGARPAWWAAFRRHQKRSEIRRQLKELQHRLDEVDGDD